MTRDNCFLPLRDTFAVKVRKGLKEEGVTQGRDTTTANDRQRGANRGVSNGLACNYVLEQKRKLEQLSCC